jgi:hypothetical protein
MESKGTDREIWKILPVCTIDPKMQCGWGFEASGTLKRSRKSWKLYGLHVDFRKTFQ